MDAIFNLLILSLRKLLAFVVALIIKLNITLCHVCFLLFFDNAVILTT